MKSFFVWVFGLLSVVLASCPKDWHSSEKSCLRFFETQVFWIKAKHLCLHHGGVLFEDSSPKKHEELTHYLSESSLTDSLWLGGNDLATEGLWVWASLGKRIFPFSNWKGHRPRRGQGRCLSIELQTQKWMASNCESLHSFICEIGKNMPLTITPSSLAPIIHHQVSFSGNGFVELSGNLMSHGPDMEIQILFKFSTTQQSFLLLWQGVSRNYMAIGIENGVAVFDRNGRVIRSSNSLLFGTLSTLSVTLHNGRQTLQLNDGDIVVSETEDFLNIPSLQSHNIFIGGHPRLESIENNYSFRIGFIGCLSELRILNHFISPKNKEKLSDYSFGDKVNFNDKHQFVKSYNVESTNECVRDPNTKLSLSLNGISDYIKLDSSLLPFHALDKDLKALSLNLNLRTQSSAGLLLLFEDRFDVFIRLEIFNGFVQLTYNFGDWSLQTLLNDFVRINNGQTHAISLKFDGDKPKLSVDSLSLNGENYGYITMPSSEYFYIGGIPNGESRESYFDGCLESFHIDYYYANEIISKDISLMGSDVVGGSKLQSCKDLTTMTMSTTFSSSSLSTQSIISTRRTTKPPFIVPFTTIMTKRPFLSTSPPTTSTTLMTTKRPFISISTTTTSTISTKRPYFSTSSTSTKRSYTTNFPATTPIPTKRPYSTNLPTTIPTTTKRPYFTTSLPTSTLVIKRTTTTTPMTTKQSFVSSPKTQSPKPSFLTTTKSSYLTSQSPCNFKEASFNGNSWVLLKFKQKLLGIVRKNEKFVITLEFTTRSRKGLILFQGNKKRGRWLMLGVKNGALVYEIQFEETQSSLVMRSESSVNDGKRHRVEISKEGNKIELIYDGRIIDKILEDSFDLNVKNTEFFIGGSKYSVSTLTEKRYESGFNGCIHEFNIKKVGSREMTADIFFNEEEYIEEMNELYCSQTCVLSEEFYG